MKSWRGSHSNAIGQTKSRRGNGKKCEAKTETPLNAIPGQSQSQSRSQEQSQPMAITLTAIWLMSLLWAKFNLLAESINTRTHARTQRHTKTHTLTEAHTQRHTRTTTSRGRGQTKRGCCAEACGLLCVLAAL